MGEVVMSTPVFLNKRKMLTAYALACGYMEVSKDYRERGGQPDIWMHKDGCYHIQGYSSDKGRLFWETCDTLPEARKIFFAKLKEYGQKRRMPR